MKLSDRLELVVSFVEPVETAADVGTDHGYVPVELVRRGIVKRAFAMDVRPGPLERARIHIGAAGLEQEIEARLSDGLSRLGPAEAETVIIAGMGGELILRILEQGRHTWEHVSQWVLSPHSELPKVRRWLWEQGFPVRREAMVCEEGKYYTVLDVGKKGAGPVEQRPEREFLYGDFLPGERPPVFLRFLQEEERKLGGLAEELRARSALSERAAVQLGAVEEKLAYNREVQYEMQGDHTDTGGAGSVQDGL